MSDLAERLHKYIADHDHPAVTSPALILLTEAADRIEALEAALRGILAQSHGAGTALWDAIEAARAALAPEQDKCE